MEASPIEALDRLAGVLVGGLVTVVTAVLMGRTALARLETLRGKLSRQEGWILSLACGAALLSTLVFALCALGWFRDFAVWAVFAGTVACWWRWGRWNWKPLAAGHDRVPRPPWLLLAVPAAVYGVLYAVHTLAPETRTDAMGYHLGLVQRYYRANGFVPLTTNIYAHISQGAEMLYLFAYSIGRESAAKLVHLAFLAATVCGILSLARRLRAELAGIFAAVAYFTCPVVIPDATSTYNDCALAFTLFCAFHLVLLWHEYRDRQWLAPLGILIGFSFAVKYTGVVAVTAGAVVVAATLRRGGSLRAALTGLALTASGAVVVGLPWLLKNALTTGNPLAPFFNAWFPNPYFSIEWESAYKFAMRSYRAGPFNRLEQFLSAPFDLVIGDRYAGSLGWVILLVPISLVAIRSPATRRLLAAALICSLPWLTNAGARFLIPSMPFALLAVGMALERVPRRLGVSLVAVVLTLQCVTSWPAQRGRFYYPDLWSVEGFPWRAALGLEPDKWHLARNVRHFLLADEIDRIGGTDTRVLSFGNLPEAYFKAELLVAYQGLENQYLSDTLLASVDPRRQPGSAFRAGWSSRQIRGLRVEQTVAGGAASWSVSEIRVLGPERSVRRFRELEARSDPHPWHAGRAFDGDPFTSWNSREPRRRGMLLEARFSPLESVAGIEIVHANMSARGQSGLKISVLEDNGRWIEPPLDYLGFASIGVDSRAMRASTNALLRRHRIRYVVLDLDPRDPYFPQTNVIAGDPAAWGLKRVFVDRTAMLFEVMGSVR